MGKPREGAEVYEVSFQNRMKFYRAPLSWGLSVAWSSNRRLSSYGSGASILHPLLIGKVLSLSQPTWNLFLVAIYTLKGTIICWQSSLLYPVVCSWWWLAAPPNAWHDVWLVGRGLTKMRHANPPCVDIGKGQVKHVLRSSSYASWEWLSNALMGIVDYCKSLEVVQRYTRSVSFQESLKFYRAPLS